MGPFHEAGSWTPQPPHYSVMPIEEGPSKLPACTAWINDSSMGAQLVLIKRVKNGDVSFVTNAAFEKFVAKREELEAMWSERGRTPLDLFLRPEDCETISAAVEGLWKDLAPSPAPLVQQRLVMAESSELPSCSSPSAGAGESPCEKTCARTVPSPVLVRISAPKPGSAQCNLRVQLVVTESPSGQTSYTVFSFTKARLLTSAHNPTSAARAQADASAASTLPAQAPT